MNKKDQEKMKKLKAEKDALYAKKMELEKQIDTVKEQEQLIRNEECQKQAKAFQEMLTKEMVDLIAPEHNTEDVVCSDDNRNRNICIWSMDDVPTCVRCFLLECVEQKHFPPRFQLRFNVEVSGFYEEKKKEFPYHY